MALYKEIYGIEREESAKLQAGGQISRGTVEPGQGILMSPVLECDPTKPSSCSPR